MTKQAKVGLVVIVIGLLIAFNYPGSRGRRPVIGGNELKLLFTQVNGLRPGDTVKIAGVNSGVITKIEFADPEISQDFSPITGGLPMVQVYVSLDNRVRVPVNSSYNTYTDLRGQRWLDILPAGGGTFLDKHDDFFGQGVAVQDDQMTRTLNAFRVLSEQTRDVRDLISKDTFRREIKDMASNMRFYSRELATASEKAPQQLADFEDQLLKQEQAVFEQLQSLDGKLDRAAGRMKTMVPRLNAQLAGWKVQIEENSGEIEDLLEQGVELSEKYQTLLAEQTELLDDPEMTKRLIIKARKMARQIEDMRTLAEDLHSLSSDPEVKADLRAAIVKLRTRSEKMKTRLDRLQEKLDNLPFQPPKR